MNIAEARKVLAQPLRFGDESQITARKFLEKVELAKDAIECCDCDHWESTRYNKRSLGEAARWMANCECVESFPKDVREQAAIVLVNVWAPV